MAERILRQKLEQLLLEQLEPYQIKQHGMRNSQLSRLIIVARQALSEVEIEQTKPDNERKNIAELAEPVLRLLCNLPSSANNQYKKARVGNQSLDKKIQEWLERPREWIENYIQPVMIAGELSSLTDELALEYTLRLIMAIAKNATKEKSDE